MSTSKIQSSAEQYLMLSGILSTVVCPILIVFIISLIIPESFGELSLFDNSKYFESEIIAQFRLYDIDVPVTEIFSWIKIGLVVSTSIFFLESLFCIAGVKIQKKSFILPWIIHLAIEFSLFTALMVLSCIAIYEFAAIPGIIVISALVLSSFFVTISLTTGVIVSRINIKTKNLYGYENSTSHSDIMSYEDKNNMFDTKSVEIIYDQEKEDMKNVETMDVIVNEKNQEKVDKANTETKNMFDAWVKTVESMKDYQKERMKSLDEIPEKEDMEEKEDTEESYETKQNVDTL